MYRHQFHGCTVFSFRDKDERLIFSNGGADLHIYGSVINIRMLV